MRLTALENFFLTPSTFPVHKKKPFYHLISHGALRPKDKIFNTVITLADEHTRPSRPRKSTSTSRQFELRCCFDVSSQLNIGWGKPNPPETFSLTAMIKATRSLIGYIIRALLVPFRLSVLKVM